MPSRSCTRRRSLRFSSLYSSIVRWLSSRVSLAASARVLAGDLEGGLVADGGYELRITDPVAELLRTLGYQRVADQALEHLVLHGLLHRGRNIAAELLLQLSLLAQPGVMGIVQRDRLAAASAA